MACLRGCSKSNGKRRVQLRRRRAPANRKVTEARQRRHPASRISRRVLKDLRDVSSVRAQQLDDIGALAGAGVERVMLPRTPRPHVDRTERALLAASLDFGNERSPAPRAMHTESRTFSGVLRSPPLHIRVGRQPVRNPGTSLTVAGVGSASSSRNGWSRCSKFGRNVGIRDALLLQALHLFEVLATEATNPSRGPRLAWPCLARLSALSDWRHAAPSAVPLERRTPAAIPQGTDSRGFEPPAGVRAIIRRERSMDRRPVAEAAMSATPRRQQIERPARLWF
jgi:hypothetical protein